MASPARFYESDRQVTFSAKNRAVRSHLVQTCTSLLAIKLLQLAMPRIINHPRPQRFRFAGDNGLRVRRHFIRTKRGVKSTHHHWHTALPKFRRDLVSALRRVSLHADRHEIRRLVPRDVLHPVVVETNLDIL